MKAVLFIALVLISLSVDAQESHPLVGTWEMVSIEGINVDGKAFKLDTTTIRETKIITPTHYMLIAMDVRGDSLLFNRCYAGHIRINGIKYQEDPTHASVQIFDNVKTDFTWKIEGDIFTQSGSFTRPDGRKIILHALKFRRVKSGHTESNQKVTGTWQQQQDSGDGPRLQIVTPTHWMEMGQRNGTFSYAVGGTYAYSPGKVTYKVSIGQGLHQAMAPIQSHLSGEKLLVSHKRALKEASFERIP
jgi:hypothetical protein